MNWASLYPLIQGGILGQKGQVARGEAGEAGPGHLGSRCLGNELVVSEAL